MEELQDYITLLLNGREELSLHSKEVSELSFYFGVYLGLGLKNVNNLRVGGLIHDIGKLEMPEQVLFKEGTLTNEEFQLIKEHPVRGEQMLLRTIHPFSKDVREIVLQHHERIDGKGYPYQLKDGEINTLAKIVSLCDVFSAITGARSYKSSYGAEYALEEIQKGLGTQFDKEIGEEFIHFMNEKHVNMINPHITIL